MNYVTVYLSMVVALLVTWLTTPDITDISIPWDIKESILRFGLTSVLIFMVISMLARLRKPKEGEEPKLD